MTYSFDQLRIDIGLILEGVALALLMATPWMLWMGLAP